MSFSFVRTFVVLLAALIAACASPAPDPTSTPTAAPATLQPTAAPVSPTLGPIPSFTTATPTVVVPTETPTGSEAPTDPPTAPPTVPPGPLADAFAAELDQILAAQEQTLRIPGMNVSIVYPDGSRWDVARGFADISRDVRVTPGTTFVVGSMTKTFVAAAIMELQEEGVLSIDDQLSNWLPDYPRAREISLAHLLSHTSGIHNYFVHPDYNRRVFNEPFTEWTPQEILDTFVLDPRFEPGAGYHYSNTNFVLLGMVIEAATGQRLGRVLRERFFDPLELDDTYSQAAGEPPVAGSLGYLQRASGPEGLDDGTNYRPTMSAATVAFGAGDIVSSAPDMADWGRMLYGGEVVEPESLALLTDYTYTPFSGESYGLGTRTRVFDGSRMFGHTGSLRGFSAAMWYFPEEELTIVVLTNRGRIDANPIVDALAAPILPVVQQFAE